MIVQNGTPIREHVLPSPSAPSDTQFKAYVKHEEECAPYPGPGFSKIRGVAAHIAKRPEHVIGALDTYHSKAGWAVAYVCRRLGKKAVVYWPKFKADEGMMSLPRRPQREAAAEGATVVALKAGRSSVLYHSARRDLENRRHPSWREDGGAYMMPNALKLPETVEETAAEVERSLASLPRGLPDGGTLVISISSGTIAAGVLAGLHGLDIRPNVILHAGYSRSEEAALRYIAKMSGLDLGDFPSVRYVDEGYGYKDPARHGVTVAFPCNPYYDLKAWRWLAREGRELPQPILFWNIGG